MVESGGEGGTWAAAAGVGDGWGGGSGEKSGGPGKVESLAVVDTERSDQFEILVAGNALGHDGSSDAAGEPDERRCERLAGRIARDLLREAQIELHDVGSQPEDVAEVRKTGADVVDREPRTAFPQRRERNAQGVVVVDLRVLRDLDHDSLGNVHQQLAEPWIERCR